MKFEYESWLIENENKFKCEHLYNISNYLECFTDEQFEILCETKMKKPNVTLCLSIILGMDGIDRFYLGEILMGLVKIFTFGCFGILYVVDIIRAKERTYQNNYIKFMQIINPQEFDYSQSEYDESKLVLNNTAKTVKTVIKGSKKVQDTFYTK